MAAYLIEFRFQSKKIGAYLKGMIWEVNRKFHVGKRRHVPHITLVGPITTQHEQRLVSDFNRICAQTPIMKFKGSGFGTFDAKRVVFVKIIPSRNLDNFRRELYHTIKSYCRLSEFDHEGEQTDFGYHSTLVMNLDPREFEIIKEYIKDKTPPDFNQIVMRVTLLKNGRILKEYDFLQKRSLNRRQALNRGISRRSKMLLKQFMHGQYEPNYVSNRKENYYGRDVHVKNMHEEKEVKNESILTKIRKMLGW